MIFWYSQSDKEHAEHLKTMLARCEEHGLVLSPTKMKIAVPQIEFLGAVIGKGTIRLQPNIIRKIEGFKEDNLTQKSGMRSWLGLLNYARSYIPNLGKLLSPLYAKTSPTGDKRLNKQD